MKRILMIITALILVYGYLFAQTESAESVSFHKAVAKSPVPGTIFLYPERIPLKDGGFVKADRGLMFVPANRSDPDSAVISVEVYRFQANDTVRAGSAPIFFLHGGPSFQGLAKQLEEVGTFEERWRPYLDIGDLVVIGQRGIGSSKPNTIIETTMNFPLDREITEEEAAAAFREACTKEKAFWEGQGLDLSGLTVVEAAADVNDVRKALGYEKVIIWGGSFGSHWGMAVMRFYPEIVERAILRGMEGPNHTYDHPGHLWNVYKRVAVEAEKAPELQGFIPEVGLVEAIKTVIERVKKKPMKVTVTDAKTGQSQDVLFTIREARRLARGYSGGLSAWPSDVIALYEGDFSQAAERALRRQGSRGFRTASFYMLDHGSGITPEREAELKKDPAVKILGDINSHYTITREVWGSDLGDEFRQNFETEIPTVIVHGTWDTSTPYENALELVPYFKNSKFIPVIRGPHGAIRAAMKASKQFRKGIMHFTATGDMSELPDEVEMPPVDWIIPELTKKQENKSLLLHPLKWRCIGPKRGGRSIAVAGHKDRPFEYYFGATGGGLWKTTDGGTTWYPVTDGQIRSSSVGAVAVAESNPDIIYLGMGESQLRQNVLQGDGVYKSTDGGQRWKHLGLEETQVISRIRIHPSNPNQVYVAALGHPFGPNLERGVFRTLDGGRTWEKILYRNECTGAIDLVLDPSNPDVLYATLWEVYRKSWILWSGGEGSGIFKSTDGGDTWRELTRNQGFPGGLLGKITVTVSGADSKRVYANVEAEKGGLYRSDDGGDTWTLINNQRDLWQRAFYFLRIQADPVDRDTIYVLNFRLLKSTDGGRTFVRMPDTHSDHHDLWIDPNNPSRMINGNDGGGVVSVNGGKTWTHMRYPTAQIYRLAVTKDFPYYACGAQQDNSTVCVPSDVGHLRNPRGPSGEWMYAVGGGESGYIAPHPTNTDIFYAGATNTLTRYNRQTGLSRDIQPYPRIVMGEPARDMPERWNWTYPIVISPLDPRVLYIGSQHLWRTTDEGKTWEKISPDLTRADPETLGDSGGPIVKDQDGPEIYATIYTIAPSPHDANTIWTGSDDGLVYLTREGGKNWKNVTPPDMPEHSRIGLIEASPHDPGRAYVAARRYEMDDRASYLWKTQNYGESWTKIVRGFQKDDFVYVVREDPKRKALLYAGTEHGVYISFNDGDSWQSLSLNLPDVPVTGLVVEERDLVIATHGRSFWVLDDIETLRQIDLNIQHAEFHLFQPAEAIRRSVPAVVDYYVKEPGRKVLVEVLDSDGQHVRTLYESTTESEGLHRHSWDLRYPGAVVFPGIILEGGNPKRGPWAPLGLYQARLVVDGEEQKRWFNVKKDPRLTDVTDEALKAQFDLALKIRDKESAANEGVILIRNLKTQVEDRLSKTDDQRLRNTAKKFVERISEIEKELYQVKNQSPKDKIAFPIRLNDRLTGLRSHLERGDGLPTKGYYQVFEELSAELTIQLQALERILQENIPYLNVELERLGLGRIIADEKSGE